MSYFTRHRAITSNYNKRHDNNNFDSSNQIDKENNEVICDSNKTNDNDYNSSGSEQNNDIDIDFAKRTNINVKKLNNTYQDVFNISEPLPPNDPENKSDVLLELSNNKILGWEKGTTLTVDDSIIAGLRESKM